MKSTFRWVFAMVLLCAAGLAEPQPLRAQEATPPLTKEQALDGWAAALGGREPLRNVRTVHLRGQIETGGLKGTYERWTTSRGELRMAVDLAGAFRQVNVFDGQKGWVLDTGGTVRELTGGGLGSAVNSAYEASYSFLFLGRMPGSVELVGKDEKLGAYLLRLEPDRGSPITVYLDAKTFLPQREVTSGPMGNRTVSFSAWRESAGILVPGTISLSNGDPRQDAVITTEQVEINGPLAVDLFAKPGEEAAPVAFAGGAPQAVIPAEVYSQHVYLPVRVNGRATGWFFVDSGAGESLISKALAEQAGLVVAGGLAGQGTGAGSAALGQAKEVALDLPGVHVPAGSVAVWDLTSLLPAVGRQWDGLLGYDVISRLVVRVDYERQQVTLYDPATFVADDRAAVLPLTFLATLPVVHAQILLPGRAPIEAECAIDSGASGFRLTTPFATANHLLEAMPRRIATSSLGAGGGETREFKGRIAGLQLGPYLLRGPVTAFSPSLKEGLLASPEIGALIGGEILERFTVTFDYPHHRILLEPNHRFSGPFRTNQSGLGLVAEGTDFHRMRVAEVEPGSPADRAGVRKGDILTALAGRPARELDLDRIDAILQQAGRTIPLTLQRKGKVVKVSLKLRERI